ncbi:MAG: copper homeostasis protein CutC [Chloroflexi bacterium]|nr:copper homeostasis protein CutC [Chloroflexota bacterium]MCY4248793.1 copper homeostasis protein CutC [Chloroflexota bacterium]
MAYTFEVAVDSLDSALAAQACGAQRIELCADLPSGGLTASPGLLELVCQRLHIPVAALIRPRRGDFLYSDAEISVMRRDIEFARQAGASAVVIGCLTADGSVDCERTGQLIEAAQPLPAVFHRAFDMCRDPFPALETLAGLGIARLLTSGQAASAEGGAPLIAQLAQRAAGRLTIMPGGGIHAENIRRIAQTTGAREFHFSGRRQLQSRMMYRNPQLSLGNGDDYARWEASATRIRAIISALTDA